MEVYILDSLYRRTALVDRFESLIWTERWKDIGDFELLLPSTPVNRSIFTPDTPVALNESKRVMLVETIEDNTDDESRTRLKVKGRSLEKILIDRLLIELNDLGIPLEKLFYQGTPKQIAELMFTHVCINGVVNVGDIVPLVMAGTSYPADTIPDDPTEIDWTPEPNDLLTLFKELCDIFEMGFRLYRDGDKGRLYFNIYTGSDRTTQQTTLPPVIFSPGLETVQNTTRLMTVETAKNVAYVMNEQGFEMVYADGVDLANPPVGLDRRVLIVKPAKLMIDAINEDGTTTQVDPTPAELSTYLIREGKNELAKHRALLAFDGEINQRSPYKYEVHYFLGDLVEMRDSDGVGNNMRVTEQIFVSDGEGDRAYPTLTVNEFIVPGAWNSWLGNRQWADFGATEYWNTQP